MKVGTSSGEHDSYKVWHRPIFGREQFSVNELKLYPVSQIGVKHTKVSGIHKWYFHISLCTSAVYSLTDRPALQLSSHTYFYSSIVLSLCSCYLCNYRSPLPSFWTEITIRVDESDCLSMASSHDQETERFLSTGPTGRRVSFNEAALFDHGKKTQEKGRRLESQHKQSSPHLQISVLLNRHSPLTDVGSRQCLILCELKVSKPFTVSHMRLLL